MSIVKSEGNYYFECPNCGLVIQVPQDQINCQKFVCGVWKETGQQVYQHIPESEALRIKASGAAWGCLGAFFFDGRIVSRRSYG